MKRRTAIGTVVGTLASIMLLATLSPRLAYADNTECTGTLTGTYDNVVVPSGADCVLSGAHVIHNVRVESGASLLATIGLGSTTIGGNATIELNAGRTFVDAATVGGQLNVWRNTGCAVEVEFNTVGGHIRVEDNIIGVVPIAECPNPPVGLPTVGTGMSIFTNMVPTGNLLVLRNSGGGVKNVVSNTVGKTLRCSDNDDPFVGGPNSASRLQGDQCF